MSMTRADFQLVGCAVRREPNMQTRWRMWWNLHVAFSAGYKNFRAPTFATFCFMDDEKWRVKAWNRIKQNAAPDSRDRHLQIR